MRISRKALIMGASAVIVLLSFFFTVILIRRMVNRSEAVTILSEVDRRIASGSFDEAADVLLRCLRLKGISMDPWMRFLKRAHSIARHTGNYAVLHAIADHASVDLPGNKTLIALDTYALLRMEKYQEAFQRSKSLANDHRFETVIAEAQIGAGILDYDAESVRRGVRSVILQTTTSRDPDILLTAARETGDNRFYLDGALLLMESDQASRAVELVKNRSLDPWPVLSLLILYDSGYLEEAKYYFQLLDVISADVPDEVALLRGDIAVRSGNQEEIRTVYGDIIRNDPTLSWIPYFNVSLLDKSLSWDERIAMAEKGLAYFPTAEELVLLLGGFYENTGMPDAAAETYRRFLDSGHESPKVGFAFDILSLGKDTGRFEAAAWKRLSSPISALPPEEILRYFTWYLMGTRSYQEALNVLKQASARYSSEWIPVLLGIAYAALGDYTEAELSLAAAAACTRSWEVWFDYALVQGRLGKNAEAAASIRNAVSLAIEEDRESRGKLYAYLSAYLYRQGSIDSARREYLYANELAPEDLETILMKRILEGGK
jgi:tetratricopeptide (TPR) repeat protein